MNRATNKPSRIPCSGNAAFTMVELALCIAIIAVAMVAILGVLPAGLGVQQQNREETIINQDASILLEAIKNGAIYTDDLTNYLDFILVSRTPYNSGEGSTLTNAFRGVWYPTANLPAPDRALQFPHEVVGLLSLPKFDSLPSEKSYSNSVVAQFRAFSGSLNEKVFPQSLAATPNAGVLDRAFRYLVSVEITPVNTRPFVITNGLKGDILAQTTLGNSEVTSMDQTLYDIGLTFQWPVFGQGLPLRVGGFSRTVHTQVAGALLPMVNPTTGVHTNMPGTSLTPRYFAPGAVSPQRVR